MRVIKKGLSGKKKPHNPLDTMTLARCILLLSFDFSSDFLGWGFSVYLIRRMLVVLD